LTCVSRRDAPLRHCAIATPHRVSISSSQSISPAERKTSMPCGIESAMKSDGVGAFTDVSLFRLFTDVYSQGVLYDMHTTILKAGRLRMDLTASVERTSFTPTIPAGATDLMSAEANVEGAWPPEPQLRRNWATCSPLAPRVRPINPGRRRTSTPRAMLFTTSCSHLQDAKTTGKRLRRRLRITSKILPIVHRNRRRNRYPMRLRRT
jgi:hypothetical protein